MAEKSRVQKLRERRDRAARREVIERMSDFQPRIVTPVLRQETETGWRVVMATFPPTLLAEGVTESEAIEIQEAKRAELGQILSPG